MGDVYQEVDETMSKLRVGMHKIKPCSRKYAFELADIPKEADYLKLMYPYNSQCLVADSRLSLMSNICYRTRAHNGHARRDIFARFRYQHRIV